MIQPNLARYIKTEPWRNPAVTDYSGNEVQGIVTLHCHQRSIFFPE